MHNRERAILENMDRLPSVVDVYKRALRVEDYFIDYLLRPYVSLAAILNRSAKRQPQLEVERCTDGAGGATQHFCDFPGL